MTTAPPRTDLEPEHDPDEIVIKGPGWFTLGALGGFFLALAAAFLILMGRTGVPDYTTEFVSERREGVAAAAESVTLVGTEFTFDPVDSAIVAGGELTLHNQGTIEHNIEIEGVAGFVVLTQPNMEASAVVDVAEGTYTIFCSIPGHREAGMEGTLEVVEE